MENIEMDNLAQGASVVGERSVCGEAVLWGVVERTEVRMPVWVAHKRSENLLRQIPKVSVARFVHNGLIGT